MKPYAFSLISMSLIMTLNASDEMQALELAAFKKLMQQKIEKQKEEARCWHEQHQQQKIVIIPAGTYSEVEAITTPFGTTARVTKGTSSNEPTVNRPQQRPTQYSQSSQHATKKSWTINPADGIIYEDDGNGNKRKVDASENLPCRGQLEELAAWSKKETEESYAKQRELDLFKDRNIYIARHKKTKQYRIMQDSHDLNGDEKLFSMCSGKSIEEVKREFGITE